MDNVRFALLCALGVVVFFLWQAWQTDYAENRQVAAPEASKTRSASDDDVPDIGRAPGPDQSTDTETASTGDDDAPEGVSSGLGEGDTVHVVTDTLDVSISTRGGDLRRVLLLGVPRSTRQPDTHLRLLNDQPPNFFVAQSGLVGADRKAPDHRDTFTSERSEYRLSEGEDSLEVPLTWEAGDGRMVRKIYTFHRGDYRVGVRFEIRNDSGEAWEVSPYQRLWRTPFQHGEEAPFAYSFDGVGWYQKRTDEDGYRYETVGFDDLPDNQVDVQQTGGWIALVQHYFLGAAVPGADQRVTYFAEPKAVPGAAREGFAAGYVGERTRIDPGGSGTLDGTLFLGPKKQDRLDAAAPGLSLTVDYGIFTVIAGPLFWVLEKLHDVVGNWGVAIILLTVIIKLAFYKLSETQFRAMARMRKFAPRMQQLKEQYGDDRQKLQEKMMELYKKEGFNPLGGCWPLLVQMPVFIALYWVLRESVELRHADFMLWINDLSSPDPYYILPLLFGITMFAQQKLSSSSMTMDPMQQRMMQLMPVVLSVFFAFFPAGLVLYWFTNNLLSIAQQWYIYRKLDHEGTGQQSAAK